MADSKTSQNTSDLYEAYDLNTFPASPTKQQSASFPSESQREEPTVEGEAVTRVSISISKEEKTCNNCKKPFSKYDIRHGIHVGIMVLVIILSCLLFVFLLLFLFLCRQYRVCPNCGKFTGDERSNGKNICLW
eukprot:TRINITY_DN4909_c0_g2_i7.p2 TRINITY_DN4909_c0_g2~~TRINITY_DN4909_c0_g2_i7.p2  ORF type:complete len:133 (+),score=25.85 TRINITY_DN4909_c0_g2_i7:121-519(+)